MWTWRHGLKLPQIEKPYFLHLNISSIMNKIFDKCLLILPVLWLLLMNAMEVYDVSFSTYRHYKTITILYNKHGAWFFWKNANTPGPYKFRFSITKYDIQPLSSNGMSCLSHCNRASLSLIFITLFSSMVTESSYFFSFTPILKLSYETFFTLSNSILNLRTKINRSEVAVVLFSRKMMTYKFYKQDFRLKINHHHQPVL